MKTMSFSTVFVVSGQRRKQGGFTLFEFAVVVTVIALLASILLNRFSFYQVEAERAEVARTVSDLRTVLHMKSAALRVKNQDAQVAGLAGQNPMEWLVQKPPNYRGEWYAPAEKDIENGNWYFDRASRELVYLTRDKKTFQKDATNRLSFKVELSRLPTIPAKPSGTPGDSLGVVLNQVNG